MSYMDLVRVEVNREEDFREFVDCGLLWFVNTIMHPFGWGIAVGSDTTTDPHTPCCLCLLRASDPDGVVFERQQDEPGRLAFQKAYRPVWARQPRGQK